MPNLKFVLNGETIDVEISPELLLVDLLRDYLGLTGTKKSCQEGECGACTIILDGEAVPSCMLPALKVAGRSVTTIEGLSHNGEIHPYQQAFIDAGAVQCGYCTPGMILSTKALLDKNPKPSREEAKVALSGNLCRCTGYTKIIDAVMLAANLEKEGM